MMGRCAICKATSGHITGCVYDAPVAEDVTYYDEGTLFKVRDALLNVVGLSQIEVTDAITAMQNAGILFRERGEGDR